MAGANKTMNKPFSPTAFVGLQPRSSATRVFENKTTEAYGARLDLDGDDYHAERCLRMFDPNAAEKAARPWWVSAGSVFVTLWKFVR